MNKINLALSVEEVNVIMAALGKLPYEAAFSVVETVRNQAIPQLQAAQEAEPPSINTNE